MQTIDIEQREQVYTVSRLNNAVRSLLEESFPFVWVEGEISNFAAPYSGHWYFSLKDNAAQVRCAMFRASQRKLNFQPKDGMQVLIKARVSLYENRGEFQLIAESIEERGEGKLRRDFDLLKKKLDAAGLFDPAHKKPLPLFPKKIGIITSATGAAIRDILTVLYRRYPCLPIVVYPTLVQGTLAASHIVKAIETATQRNECDVLILSRGGGSLEDLWPFNEEIVAHAIFNTHIPIISGVGHEVDFTIADFVADKRAATPSAAAEIVTPDKAELLQILIRSKQQMSRHMQHILTTTQQKILWTQKHLAQQHPKRRLTEKMQRLDFYELSFIQLQNRLTYQLQTQLKNLDAKLHQKKPIYQIHSIHNQINLYQHQLNHFIRTLLNKQQTSLANAGATLDALSPLATLKRGYAIATTKKQHVVHVASELKIGDDICVRFLKGSVECKVEKIDP